MTKHLSANLHLRKLHTDEQPKARADSSASALNSARASPRGGGGHRARAPFNVKQTAASRVRTLQGRKGSEAARAAAFGKLHAFKDTALADYRPSLKTPLVPPFFSVRPSTAEGLPPLVRTQLFQQERGAGLRHADQWRDGGMGAAHAMERRVLLAKWQFDQGARRRWVRQQEQEALQVYAAAGRERRARRVRILRRWAGFVTRMFEYDCSSMTVPVQVGHAAPNTPCARGCRPTCSKLQPHVLEAVAPCARGCSPVCSRL